MAGMDSNFKVQLESNPMSDLPHYLLAAGLAWIFGRLVFDDDNPKGDG